MNNILYIKNYIGKHTKAIDVYVYMAFGEKAGTGKTDGPVPNNVIVLRPRKKAV